MFVHKELAHFSQLSLGGRAGSRIHQHTHSVGFKNAFTQSNSSPNSLRSFHNYSVPLSTTQGIAKAHIGPEMNRKSFSPLLSRKSYNPANTKTSSRSFGFVKMSTQPTRGPLGQRIEFSPTNGFLQMSQPETTILQFSDLMYYQNLARYDQEAINLVKTVAERVKPNLVVFTGEVVDGRYCKDYTAFRNALLPLVKLQIPWTYIPGRSKHFTREELLDLYSLPMCASKGASSFTHTLKVGFSQIHFLDKYGGQAKSHFSLSPDDNDNFAQQQLDLLAERPSDGGISLAFHYGSKQANLLKGPSDNDFHDLLNGREQWNEFVTEAEGVWMTYGQVNSGISQRQTPQKKERFGRVIRYDPSMRLLSTWIENKKGVDNNSIISRRTVADMPSLHVDE